MAEAREFRDSCRGTITVLEDAHLTQLSSTATAGDKLPPLPQTEDEAERYVVAVGAWFQKRERDQARMRELLSIKLALGIATCLELVRFNRQVAELWQLGRDVLDVFRDAGAQAPSPPWPALFGARAWIEVDFGDPDKPREIIRWDMSTCLGGSGLADRAKVRLLSPCPAQLDGLDAAFVIPAIVIVVGVVAVGWTLQGVIDSMNGVPGRRVDARMRSLNHDADIKRMEMDVQCALSRIDALPPADKGNPDITGQIWRECVEHGKATIPVRADPTTRGRVLPWLVLGGIGIGGIVLANTFLRTSKPNSPTGPQ